MDGHCGGGLESVGAAVDRAAAKVGIFVCGRADVPLVQERIPVVVTRQAWRGAVCVHERVPEVEVERKVSVVGGTSNKGCLAAESAVQVRYK